MARIGVDYNTVKQAAIKLLSQGINPSVQKIRDLLGTGSNTTLAEHLNQWREEHAQKIVHHLPATMPKELISAVEVLWQAAVEQSENQLATYKTELDSQQEKIKQEQLQNQQYFEQIKQQLSQTSNQLTDKTTEYQTLQTNFAVISNQLELKNQQLYDTQQQFESRLQRAYQEKDSLADKNQQLLQEIKSLQEKLNDEAKTHKLNLQEGQAQHEQSENRWLMLIDQARQEIKGINKEFYTYRNSHENNTQNLNLKLSEFQKELYQKNLQVEEKAKKCKQIDNKKLNLEAELFATILIYEYKLNKSKALTTEIKQELMDKYKKNRGNLDKKFLREILTCDIKKINSSLWEMIVIDHFSKFTKSIEHKDDGPDWKIKINEKEYFIEAVCANFPEGNSPEINRVIEESKTQKFILSDENLIREVKLRLSNVIDGKIKKHESFMKNKECGYILCVSYGSLYLLGNHSIYEAVSTIFPIDSIQLEINPQTRKTENVSLSYKDNLEKAGTDKSINTNIFMNKDYSWISAILFSKAHPCFLLEHANEIPGIYWGETKNDFELVHNPFAKYPLTEKIFEPASTIRIVGDKLVTEKCKKDT